MDLLPPEVRAAQRARATVRVVVALVAILACAVGLAVASVSLLAVSARAALAEAEARTESLLSSQDEFSEGRNVANQITELTDARVYGAMTEVDWKTFLDPIRGSLPEGGTIKSAVATAPAPWEAALIPADSLRSARIGTIVFSVLTPTQAGATEWARTLVTVPGYADSTTDSVTFVPESNAFLTVVTLNIDEGARSNRFAPVEEE